jgi:hypothetical protein
MFPDLVKIWEFLLDSLMISEKKVVCGFEFRKIANFGCDKIRTDDF